MERQLDLDLLKKLTKSHHYVHKGKELPTINQLIEKLKMTELSVVKADVPMEVADNGEVYYAYPKVIFEFKHHSTELDNQYFGTTGILVNFTKGKFTVYGGVNAVACLNLSIFNADVIREFSFEDSFENVPEIMSQAKDKLASQITLFLETKERLEKKEYDTKTFEHRKGNILSTADVTLFPYLLHAEKQLRDGNSIYSDMPLTDWTLLQAMTDKIYDGSVSNRIKTTLALESLFV